jgi:prepilin signal peptidase PulO-like enzyme (type II secretory pathway)
MEESILMVAADATSTAIEKLLKVVGVPEKQAVKFAPFVFFAVLLAAAFSAWFYISGNQN